MDIENLDAIVFPKNKIEFRMKKAKSKFKRQFE